MDLNVVIYFFSHAPDRIKIGTSRCVQSRMRSLSTIMGTKLELIGQIPGNSDLERAIHSRLQEHRIGRTEWFHDCEAVRAFIGDIISHESVGVEPLSRVANPQRKPITEGGVSPDAFVSALHLMWKEETVFQIAALAGESEKTVMDWMAGRQKWPTLVRWALCGVFSQFLLSDGAYRVSFINTCEDVE